MQGNLSVVGIDIAKRVFHLVGMDARGKIVMRKRCSRGEVLPLLANLAPTTIGMEACGGAHYWARRLREQGHEVKLMAPQFVKPYIKSDIAPCGRTLKHQLLYQGPDRCALDSYVPRLITFASS